MKRSLTTLLTLPLLGALVLLGLIVFGVLYQRVEVRLTQEFDEGLVARMRALNAVTRFEVPDEDEGHAGTWIEFDFDPETAPEFDPGPDAEYFEVWEPSGRLGRSRSLAQEPTLHPQPMREAHGALDDPGFIDAPLPDGRAGRYGRIRLLPPFDEDWHEDGDQRARVYAERFPGETRPILVIDVAISRAPLDQVLGILRISLLIGLIALLAMIAILVPLIVRFGLAPVRGLSQRLGSVNASRLDTRLDPAALPRELTPIAEATNSLLERLGTAFEKERLFSRNVAHELRTPIAELRSLGEVYAEFPDLTAATQRYGEVAAIAQRMGRLVDDLLLMARQEQDSVSLQWESLDLVAQARSALARFPAERTREFAIEAPESCRVRADASLLDSILNNLIDNAIEHRRGAGAGGLCIRCADERVKLEIHNPAQGLVSDDLPRLFDRFWRKDAARTSGRHTGLGLSLVAALCEALGWRIEARLDSAAHLHLSISGIEPS